MEVVNACEHLFDVEMRNIDRQATGLLDFIPEVTRIDGLISRKCQDVGGMAKGKITHSDEVIIQI